MAEKPLQLHLCPRNSGLWGVVTKLGWLRADSMQPQQGTVALSAHFHWIDDRGTREPTAGNKVGWLIVLVARMRAPVVLAQCRYVDI